jgi:hypothetical protein
MAPLRIETSISTVRQPTMPPPTPVKSLTKKLKNIQYRVYIVLVSLNCQPTSSAVNHLRIQGYVPVSPVAVTITTANRTVQCASLLWSTDQT